MMAFWDRNPGLHRHHRHFSADVGPRMSRSAMRLRMAASGGRQLPRSAVWRRVRAPTVLPPPLPPPPPPLARVRCAGEFSGETLLRACSASYERADTVQPVGLRAYPHPTSSSPSPPSTSSDRVVAVVVAVAVVGMALFRCERCASRSRRAHF